MKTLLLLLFGGAKFGKLLTTVGTMLVSLVVYAWIYGWRYAAGFLILLLCHEMGHYIAARRRGLEVGAPTFIPFVGAWIQLKQMPHDAETEAYIGLAGPLVGTLAAVACYFMARNVDSQLLLAVSYAGFFLNLFNMIPVPPFDGGRITAAISRKLWLVGAPVLLGLFLWHPNPILVMMGAMAAPQIWRAFSRAPDAAEEAYYMVDAGKRMEYGVLYLGLLIYLALMTEQVHMLLGGDRAIF
jgi:Zn-dependent protease